MKSIYFAPLGLAFFSLMLLVASFLPVGSLPDITPGPSPEHRGDVVVIIYESDPSDPDYNASVLALLGKDKYWATYADRGLRWTKYDKDATEIGGELRREIADYKIPVLAILEKDGTAVHVQGCPTDVDKLDEVVRKVTGR